VHSAVKKVLMSGDDSGLEEIYRRRTSIKSHKVDQHFGRMGITPQPEFERDARTPAVDAPPPVVKIQKRAR